MKRITQTVYVTDDGATFNFEDDAARHERRGQGSAKIEALLLELPAMRDAADCYGSDVVEDILGHLSDWLFMSPVSADLMKLARHREKSRRPAPAGKSE